LTQARRQHRPHKLIPRPAASIALTQKKKPSPPAASIAFTQQRFTLRRRRQHHPHPDPSPPSTRPLAQTRLHPAALHPPPSPPASPSPRPVAVVNQTLAQTRLHHQDPSPPPRSVAASIFAQAQIRRTVAEEEGEASKSSPAPSPLLLLRPAEGNNERKKGQGKIEGSRT
ncbi:unnamed protein product, partial [Linum tenue]